MKLNLRFRGNYCPNSKRPLNHKTIIVSLLLASGIYIAHGQPSFAIRIAGTVISAETARPLDGATITLKTGQTGALTDESGKFILSTNLPGGEITVSHIGYQTQTIRFGPENKGPFTIRLERDDNTLEEVEVNTGYQTLNRRELTGSIDHIDQQLFNRRVGTTVIDRIENLTPGLSFGNTGATTTDNQSGLLIRGHNSLYSSVAPLIVLDNFPYDGPLESINPNDVLSVSILKDAAAAAQWGARAGNGVIVITTKTGTSARPTVAFNGNTNVQQRPDLLHIPVISASDYIDLEQFLFDKGYYDPVLQGGGGIPPVPVTPVVALLAGIRQGTADGTIARKQIEQMKSRDVYGDLREYFYQPAVNQQYALQVSGKSGPNSYYLSGGYDGGTATLKGNNNQRLTLRTRNVFQISHALQIEAGMNFTNTLTRSGGNLGTGFRAGTKGLYPYAQLVNDDGTARALEYEYRQQYTDTAGGGRLLDWQYRPLDEIYATEQRHRTTDVVVSTGMNYQVFPFLQAALKYQYQRAVSNAGTLNSIESYYTRNLINRYYQPGAAIEFPVPHGGIQNNSTDEMRSHQARLQLSLQHRFEGPHRISGLAGWEIKDLNRESSRYRIFGYNRMGSQVYPGMDFVTRYPMFTNPGQRAAVPNAQSIDETTDRFMSLFVNSSYTYRDRYTLSASMREDAANLFGVATNQKGVPLWSAGIRWQAGEEPFYGLGWLPRLDIRLTYGVAGNFSRMVSALTTVTYGTNAQGLPAATINNPPNKNLRWEQNRTFNVAVDLGLAGGWLNGTVEYYTKRNNDLMAEAPVDPTYGLVVGTKSSFFGNVAAIAGKGLEVQLHTNLREGAFRWNGSLLFSRAQTWITAYFMPRSTQASSYTGSQFNLLEGYPVYTQFSYRWAGLDPQTGDPVGILDGEDSKAYSNIINQTSPDSLVYNGPAQAPYFGAFRNRFSWNGFTVSCNISYRFGHIFRRNSIQYGGLFGSWTGHSDYALRWREPGDEAHTDVPSLAYPAISQRDQFYSRAAVLAESAAIIRLEDIRLDYTFTPDRLRRAGIRSCQVYGYIRNPGVMHAFNSRGIDPTYQNGSEPGISVAVGLNISF